MRSPWCKTYGALGMREAGIKLIGPGDITQDIKLQAMGDAAVGLITMHHYNADLDNAENKRFVAAWKKDYGADSTPDFMAVGGYDGMAAIVHVVQATKGKMRHRRGARGAQGLEVQQPARPDLDRSRHPRHRHERVSGRGREGTDGKLHQKQHRQDRQRQGRLQGAEDRPLCAEVTARRSSIAPLNTATAVRGGGLA